VRKPRTAEEAYARLTELLSALPPAERARFGEMTIRPYAEHIYSVLLECAIVVVQENPLASRGALREKTAEAFKQTTETYQRRAQEDARVKFKNKQTPANARRREVLQRLRNVEKLTWGKVYIRVLKDYPELVPEYKGSPLPGHQKKKVIDRLKKAFDRG
jgi:hypothetical protein